MDRINSDESEGLFSDFMDQQLSDLVEEVISGGDIIRGGGHGADIIVEMDDISPPSFVYGDGQDNSSGIGTSGPGSEGGRLRFDLSFDRFMELAAKRLSLPNLTREGRGRIKQVAYSFKTFGPTGVILDRRRTFRRALRTSVGTGLYAPDQGRLKVEVRRRDRRYRQAERVEKPRHRAVCFYIGDISYSTLGARLEMQKRLLNFVHNWLDYSYGQGKVDHRFFVHDAEAYEVTAAEFYQVGNAGGTRAAMAFDLIARVARNEYDPATTNLYAFYVGDGELFHSDAAEIMDIVSAQLRPMLNRLCVTEIKPGSSSCLVRQLNSAFPHDSVVRGLVVKRRQDIVPSIQKMFEVVHAQH